eukprot:jgi/Chrzof1/7002/Cz02g07080.t1
MKKSLSGPDYSQLQHDPEHQDTHAQHQQTSRKDKAQLLNFTSSSLKAAVLSGLLYTTSSAALTLLNKKVLVHYGFTAVHALLCFHCMLAVLLVKACSLLQLAQIEPLTLELVQIWLPVNLIFVGMLATNFYALQTVGVGMVSILKNLANLFIIIGDYVFFKRTYSWHIWLCLSLMIVSVVAGGATDVQFSLGGYGWQMVNNVFTAAYALYLSRVTEKLGSHTVEHKPLNQLSMVYYNNVLTIPVSLLIVVFTGEFQDLLQQPALRDTSFQVYATLGGVLGFCLSFSSIWFVSLTTATLYSLMGSLNKVVVAAVGIWLFQESTEPRNLASIIVGLAAGALLPFIKSYVS